MAGVLAGHYLIVPGPAVLVVSGLSLVGVVSIITLRRRMRIIPVLLVLLLWTSLGLLSYQVRYRRCPEDDIVRYSAEKPILVRLQGEILDDPHWSESNKPWPSDPSLYFHIGIDRIHTRDRWSPASGIVSVRVKQPLGSRTRGQRLELLGWLSRYQRTQNPGQFDWQQYQRFRGRFCRLSVVGGAGIRNLAGAPGGWGLGLLDSLRKYFSAVLSDEDFSIESNSLLKAMVLGERDAAFRRLNEAFQKTGLFHFLCVSGLHLGLCPAGSRPSSNSPGNCRGLSALPGRDYWQRR